MISEQFSFYAVHGIPTGAVRIERALNKYCNPNSSYLLIVDDVLTTGNSMEEAKLRFETDYNQENILGVVLFARVKPPEWVYPIFQLWSKP
jgi:hypoxanthine phosphoribosyltransferase